MSATHLHCDDVPDTLAIVAAVLANHTDTATIGYKPDEWGADVDWDMLDRSYLSTTERATLRIARGCATIETHDGRLPDHLRGKVLAKIEGIL